MDERIQSGCCNWIEGPMTMGFRQGGRVPVSCPVNFQGRYTVRAGDTMFLIAQRFGVSLQALINANPHIPNPAEIFPGDVLCVPGAGAPPSNGRVPASCPVGFQGRYTVVSGDTMFFIAQRFGVSLNALIAANPHITNPAEIFPGDVLCVPGAAPSPDCRIPASCPVGFQGRYTVQSGDTMFLIAQRFGVSLNALIAANPHITNPNEIFPCDVLCVPGAAPAPDCRIPASCPVGFQGRYTVQPGDTMFLIAQRFGVSLNALIAANPHITNPAEIFPCDVLCVPGAAPECRIPASCPVGFQGRYTVQPGDTMFLIAQRFGVSLNALIAANPHITNPNEIFPCDVLCVPGAAPECRIPTSCPVGFQGRYTVQPGDTMFLIAQRFGVSLDALIVANPHITNPNEIFPCDVLCVPGAAPECRIPASCPPGFQGRYTVQPGDTMFLIAQRFGVSLNALIAANPHITNPAEIFPCDVLCVPGTAPECRIPASCPVGFQGRYTVQPGDTMFLIAQRFGVSLNALIAANPHITNPAEIFPCDVLCVPGAAQECRIPASCPVGFKCRYTVQPGDTMFLIAQRFGVSLNALIAANPHITNPAEIFPCDVLCVPCAAEEENAEESPEA